MNIDEFVPLEIDPEKAEEILSKVKKTLRNFALSTGRNFAVMSKDALSNQKYHKNYLELREEGLALDVLVQDAQKSIASSDNSTVFPKFINTRYVDARFDIFTRHLHCISNCTEIEFDPYLKTGQIVAYLTGENIYSVGMIAPKVDDEIYRIFNLSKEYEYELVKINDIYPFPAIFPNKYDSTIGFQPGTKVFIIQNDQNLDRTKSMILKGTILKFDETSTSDQIKYVVELEDNQQIVVKAQFITKQESPFHIEDEEGAKTRIQELINQGIDQLALLDPKEAKKYKISAAKKNKQKRKQEGIDDDAESTQEVDEEGRPIQKKKQRKELGPVRHSPRTRTATRLSLDASESNAEQQASSDDENENENEQQQETIKEEQQYPTLNHQQIAPTFSNNLFPQPIQSNTIYQYPQRCQYMNFTNFPNPISPVAQGMPINLQNAQLGPLTSINANQRQPYQFSQHPSQQQLYQPSPHLSQPSLNEQPTPISMTFIQPTQNQTQQIQSAYIQPITLPQLTPQIEKKPIIVNQPIPEIQQPNVTNEQNFNNEKKQILNVIFEQNQKSDNSLNKMETQTTVQISTQNDHEEQSPEN